MKLSSKQIKQFQKHILDWYRINERDLPWRRVPYDTRLQQRDPYRILVSEIMLQQTQVSRVIPKYDAWLKRFPTVQDLAKATTAEVLTYWSGLGYNRRALYLQRLAKELVKRKGESVKGKEKEDQKNIFPQTEEELMKLPGIGKYTARALLCFAFNQQVAVVDTNVKKVILTQLQKESRKKNEKPHDSYFLLHDSVQEFRQVKITDHEIQEIANQLLPQGHAYEWNQALMDYSSAVLKNHKVHPLRQGFGGQAKQTKFKDSDRYYRGAIIRFLIHYSVLSFEEIYKKIQEEGKIIEISRLKRIVDTLEKDALVIKKNNLFYLPE